MTLTPETTQSTASAAVRDRIRALEGTGMRTFAEDEPLVWARTSGTTVWDEEGRPYLDLYAGFAATTVGYCHPKVTAALVEQAQTMTHCPSAAPSRLRADFYERLIDITPARLERVMLAVTGSAANELAVQLARVATGRHAVVSFSGAYVGRTVGAVGLAGKRAYRSQLAVEADAQFLPYPDPYRSPWAGDRDPGEAVLGLLDQMVDDPASGVDDIACIVVEPIQGNGGVVMAPDGFLAGLRRIADRAGAVLIFDEIQSGLGRSGRMWACDHEAVVPDLMTVGKGIGGGLTLAAVVGREELMTTWAPDATTSTFLANALNLTAGVAALDVVCEERLEERSATLGAVALQRLREGLAGVPAVGDVRGRGLFIGIELVGDRAERQPAAAAAAAAARALRDHGVLVGRGGRHGNVLKLSPALVIEPADLDHGLTTVLEVLNA
jgi:4-aminobutyrate aminotransferase-like enzyme